MSQLRFVQPESEQHSVSFSIARFAPAIKAQQHDDSAGNDNERLSWPVAKRLKECLQDDGHQLSDENKKLLQEIQNRFRAKCQALPYKKFIAECHVNQLLDDYLGLLMIGCESNSELMNIYSDEREYYYHHQPEVTQVTIQLRFFIKEVAVFN